MNRIALISTPWPLFNRPSLQLGCLKPFVRQNLPETAIDVRHLYLSIAADLGYDLYRNISESTWLAEPLYAALLYPDRTATISQFWKKRSSGLSATCKYDFHEILNKLEKRSAEILDNEDWGRYTLAGFSICFSQLTSSLYFIHEIKRRAPELKIVVGGSLCAGDMGASLIHVFPEIDFVIHGEGELPLMHLIKSLTISHENHRMDEIPGLISRDEKHQCKGVSQVSDLDQLPIPSYGDYFYHLASLGPDNTFYPKIPMEISRGCWWKKGAGPAGSSGCSFCNLNIQWQGYRSKSHNRTIRELETLINQYQDLSVSFMDNLLPASNLKELFGRIKGLGKDLHLFAEIRATTRFEVLETMGKAGMHEVQVGIEALSTGLLKKINKGTTALDNMEIMKNCEIPGFPDLTGNLILYFPSSDERDVDETIANLEFALRFRPLKGIPFWLGYGSPVWQNPGFYGIRRVRNHPFYKYLFPPKVLKGLKLMIQGYQGGVRYQKRLWQPVKTKLEEWKKTYSQLHTAQECGPILSFQDGGDFMIIRERRHGQDNMTHRLKDTSRKIYLFCQAQRSFSEILARFPGFGADKVAPFLRMMVDKRLMFNEKERYLSLAVPAKGISHPQSFR